MDAADPIALAEGFPAATREQWLDLVAKTLKGAGLETLTKRTADGVEIAPLYTARDLAPGAGGPLRQTAGWDIRARVPAGAEANAVALDALAGGATSLLVEASDGGRDLAQTLAGVVSEVAPIALDAGFAGVAAASALDSAVKASPTALLAFHLDPLGAFAVSGMSAGPIDAHLQVAAARAARLAETYPKASLFLAGGSPAHEAGGAPAIEIAVAASAAVAYAKALAAAGLAIEDAFGRIVLGVAAEAEPIPTIAKLRAMRAVWGRLTAACGVVTPARIEARSSRRMLTRADHWTNLIRLTVAGFGAAVGGADAIVLEAFTEPLGTPEAPLALRQARNIQLVLMEEAGLASVADPAAGCWALEAQTQALARVAWERFREIEAAGGLVPALVAGVVARAVEAGREALAEALAKGERRIVGVTDFKAAEPSPPAPQTAPPPDPVARTTGEDSRCPPLAAIRLEDLVA